MFKCIPFLSIYFLGKIVLKYISQLDRKKGIFYLHFLLLFSPLLAVCYIVLLLQCSIVLCFPIRLFILTGLLWVLSTYQTQLPTFIFVVPFAVCVCMCVYTALLVSFTYNILSGS